MIAVNTNTNVELGDLVIANTGSLFGKVAYRVTNDPLHIRLENIDNGYEYKKLFGSLHELQEYIQKFSDVFLHISLH